MKISIIIPIYKAEKYLRQCIDSVICQASSCLEVILVDDGSPDKCSEICDEYANKYDCIRVIHKKNQGVSIARQVGVESSNGDYITFLDSDDWFENNLIKKMISIINTHEPDIIRFGLIREDKSGSSQHEIPQFMGLYDKNRIEQEIFPILIHSQKAEYFSPSLCGGVFRSSLIKRCMIADSRAKIGEDGACVIPAIAASSSMYFVNECFYHYRYNSESATKSHKVFDWNNPEIVARHIEEKMDIAECDFQQQLYRKITHDVFNVAYTQFYRSDLSFGDIVKDISCQINRKYYSVAISKAKFHGRIAASLMLFSLKHRMYSLMYLYSKIK